MLGSHHGARDVAGNLLGMQRMHSRVPRSAFRDAVPVGVADVDAGRYRKFDSQSEQASRLEEQRAGICMVGQARRDLI